jgi:hypothetical protein
MAPTRKDKESISKHSKSHLTMTTRKAHDSAHPRDTSAIEPESKPAVRFTHGTSFRVWKITQRRKAFSVQQLDTTSDWISEIAMRSDNTVRDLVSTALRLSDISLAQWHTNAAS